jgi:hypothetical protein
MYLSKARTSGIFVNRYVDLIRFFAERPVSTTVLSDFYCRFRTGLTDCALLRPGREKILFKRNKKRGRRTERDEELRER